jgi:hypothetical protein
MNEAVKYAVVGLGLLWVLSLLPEATWMYDSGQAMCDRGDLAIAAGGVLACS